MIIYHQKVNYGNVSILRTFGPFGPQPKPKGDRMTAATKCNLASLVKMLSTNSCSGRSDMCFFIKTLESYVDVSQTSFQPPFKVLKIDVTY